MAIFGPTDPARNGPYGGSLTILRTPDAETSTSATPMWRRACVPSRLTTFYPLCRMLFPKPYADAVAKLRVPSGFLLVIAFCWLATPTLHSLAIGVPVSILGLLLRAWAAGHLAKNRATRDGRTIRLHPQSAVCRYPSCRRGIGDCDASCGVSDPVWRCVPPRVFACDSE